MKEISKKAILVSSRQQLRQAGDTVDIRPLKAFVSEKFSGNSAFRDMLLSERDTLKTHEFLAKIETWLNLLRVVQ